MRLHTHLYTVPRHVYTCVMRMDMRMDTRMGMRMDTRMGMRMDMCMDMRMDMRTAT